jgi:outer membrane protein assembly factor BamA
MTRYLLLLLLLTIAASAEEIIVHNIKIVGNYHTKEWVIRRELQFRIGDRLSGEEMEAARKRLLNLQIFNNVFITQDEAGDVTVEVSEQFQYIPLLGLTSTDGRTQDAFTDFGSFFDIMTATVGVADLNHRGHGGTLSASVRFGATDGFAVNYATRWLSPHLPVRFTLGTHTLLVSDKHSSVQDTSRRLRDQSVYTVIGTRSGANAQVGVETMFQRIVRQDVQPRQQNEYNTYWISPFAVLDRRDLEWYPSRGVYAKILGSAITGDTPFVRSQYAVANYIPLNESKQTPVLAMRFAGATSTSSTPDWAHYFFGFSSLLRGYSSIKSEAATYLLGDLELRIPCVSEKTYNIGLLGHWGRNIPFWWGLVFFGERTELQLNGNREELWAGGIGVDVRVPFIQIAEVSWSLNRESESDIMIQTGVKF